MKYSLMVVLALACGASAQSREHAEAGFTLRLPAAPAVVFPLFGPIRESEWAPHWNPAMLYPPEGIQKAGAVFTTRQHDEDAIWILTAYDEAALRISYVILSPQRNVAQLDVALKAVGDRETEATVTHRWTSLSDASDASVKRYASEFPLERDHWQRAIAHRLRELTEH